MTVEQHVYTLLIFYKINVNCFEGYAITIIFGGDLNSLKVLENDIKNNRPIVLIQVSLF
jgi:hypothetical protein